MERAKDKNRIGFFPDYRLTNDYQSMLYFEQSESSWEVEALLTPFNLDPSFDAIHFHWQNAIWPDDVADRKLLLESNFEELFRYKCNSSKSVKTIWTVHNATPHETWDMQSEIELMQKMSYESDVIHLLSEESIDELEKFIEIDPEKVVVVPHSSYFGFAEKGADIAKTRAELGIPATSIVIGFVGMIRPYKNLPLLLEIFQDLKREFQDLVLVVAGLNQDPIVASKILAVCAQYPDTIFIDDFLSREFFASVSSVIQIACFPYSQILNSGSIFSSFTFGHHVVAPNHHGLKSLQDLPFVSFFEKNDSMDLMRVLRDLIGSGGHRESPDKALLWAKENDPLTMSRQFFQAIDLKLF